MYLSKTTRSLNRCFSNHVDRSLQPSINARVLCSTSHSQLQPKPNVESSDLPWVSNKTYWNDESNHKKFVDWAGKQLNIKDMSDWYKVSTKDLDDLGGRPLLAKYTNSPSHLLATIYPDYDWLLWKFDMCPRGYWDNVNNQIKFVKWASTQLNIKEMSDWYNVTIKEFIDIGGSSLLVNKYNSSIPAMLSKMYSEYEWLPWRFVNCPKNYWEDVNNQKKFMGWVAKELNVKDTRDWYKVPALKLKVMGGSGLFKKYDGMLALLRALYPDYEWLPWRFETCPVSYWDDVNNQIKFIKWVANELNIKEMNDWYKVTHQDICDLGGTSLLQKYNNSLPVMLSKLVSDFEWLPWKFAKCPQGYWDDIRNQRKFMDWASIERKIKEPSDWYNVSAKELSELGGTQLLKKYNQSPASLLSAVYPEHEWLPWQFLNTPKHFWNAMKNQRKFLDWAGNKLGVKDLNDWYKVPVKDVIDLGGKPLLSNGSLLKILSQVYPSHKWEISSKNLTQRKTQEIIKGMLKTMFPTEEVLEEHKHPDLKTFSGYPLELDFFYPKLNLALEYQGQQHYRNIKQFSKSNVDEDKSRDLQKSKLCKEKGITLVEIPYWWNRTYDSLAATIYNLRPDLFTEKPTGEAIPLNSPLQTKSLETAVNKVLMNATVWDEKTMDPTGWLMSEKYDGMRLYWNGTNFLSRQGKKAKIPETMTRQLPYFALDGELWTQYGLYQEAVSLGMRSKPEDEKWQKAVFWVFDAPNMIDKTYQERIEKLKEMKERGQLPEFVKIVESTVCNGKEHLKEYFDRIIKKGGEGVVLREPGSLYKGGRSNSLRKYKHFFDTEVKIVENNYPHGLNCIQANGKPLFVSINDNHEEAKKLAKGTIVTIKYLGTNAYGTLQYPQFYRERHDVKWEDVNKNIT